MRKLFALLIPILLLSGCLGSDESIQEPQEEIVMLEQHFDNHSHQFWNTHPHRALANNSVAYTTHPQEIHYMNMSNITGSLTVQVQASGSDNQADEEPGDYFVAIATFDLKY